MAADYGFKIDVSGNSLKQMKDIEDAIKKLGGTVKDTSSDIKENFGGIGEAAKSLQSTLIEAFSVYEIYNFGKELMHLAAEFQGFDNVIKYSSEGIVDNAKNIDYLNDAVVRLHLPMEQAFQTFSEMQAGFFGTGIEGEKLRKVFEGVSEAATVMHLSPDAFSRTAYAMKEIGELGTVQMRQMRMLAMALPGSMNIAAQSMGMTTMQFHEAMKKGQIQSSIFLPKFAAALTTHFNPGLENAGKSLISQINDEKNSVLKTMLDMGNSLMPLWLDILQTVSSVMHDIKSLWDGLTGNSNFVNFLKEVFDWAVKLIPIWLAYRGVMAAVGIVTSVFSVENGILTASLGEVTVMTDGATFAFEGLSSAIASTGIGALVIGLGLVIEKLISMNEELDAAIDKKYKLSESDDQFKSLADQAAAIKEQYSIYDKLDPDAKSKLKNDVAQYNKEAAGKAPVFDVRREHLAHDAQKNKPILGSFMDNLFINKLGLAADSLKENAKTMAGYVNFIAQDNDFKKNTQAIQQMAKKIGAPPKDKYDSFGASKSQSLNTSNLSGASGGLGSAKSVFIRIGVLQQNNGVKESQSSADQAVQKIIEAINGFDQSVNSQ